MEGKIKMNFQLQNVGFLGKNLYVGRPAIYSTIGTEDIIEYASKAASVSKSCMIQTIAALYDAFEYYLCNGHSFKLDGLGTFSLSLSAQSSEATYADAVTGADAVRSLGINFLADKKMKQLIQDISISTVAENPNTLTEELQFIPRVVNLGGDKANILSYNSMEGHFLPVGKRVELTGWNVYDEGVAVQVDGKDAEDASISEEFLCMPKGKNGNYAVAKTLSTKNFVKVTGITIDGNVYTYSGNPQIASFKANDVLLANGQVVNIGTAENPQTVTIEANGYVEGKTLKVDGNAVQLSVSTSSSLKSLPLTLLPGSHTIELGVQSLTIQCVYNNPGETTPNVTSLSANGVTVGNGGSSTMIQGQTYDMVALGTNLGQLAQSDIVVPTGSVVSNFSASANRVQFSVYYGGTAGDIKIGEYFQVGITTAEAEAHTLGGVAAGGTIRPNIGDTLNIVPWDGTKQIKVVDSMTGSDAALGTISEGTLFVQQAGDVLVRLFDGNTQLAQWRVIAEEAEQGDV